MELQEAIRTNGTCRYYTDEPLDDVTLAKVIDTARFAPQGGNRQPVRYVVVRDPAKKAQLKEWYLGPWKAYLEATRTGEKRIGTENVDKVVQAADDFAEHLDEYPALIVVCGVLEDLHPTDTELDRFGIVGGGSIYPSVQNLLLAAREQGLGTTLTTLLVMFEPQVRELLKIPEGVGIAAVVAIGWPAKPFPKKLSRRPVEEIAFLDEWDNTLPGADAV
jgi:nitroreductase